MSKFWRLIIFLSLFSCGWIGLAQAQQLNNNYPRLANYYLKYYGHVQPADLENLKRWDLLILPNDYQWAFPGFFQQYRQAQPSGYVLAYVYPAMVMSSNLNNLFRLVDNNDLWLRDGRGQKIEMWSGLYAVNITKPEWQKINCQFLKNDLNWRYWDGLMFDTVENSLSRFNNYGIDLSCSGQADSLSYLDKYWQQGMVNLFQQARQDLGKDKLMIINGTSLSSYQANINGRMFETFPAHWEGNGSWAASMEQYLNKLPAQNYQPNLYVINSNTDNTGQQNNYRKMRFGLTSALLGDGYFSFDYGDQAHEQVWWYDEYSVNLGQAISGPHNLLTPNNNKIQAGLWRRDFEKGVAIVNSTSQRQLYSLGNEELEKVRGSQDPLVNNGQRVNYLNLEPYDGLILLKRNLEVTNQTFFNGGFVRVFDQRGQSQRNGFFSYQPNLAAGDQVILTKIDNQSGQIINRRNEVMITKQGQIIHKWHPFGNLYLERPSIALYQPANKQSEIVVGAGKNTKPVVRFYNHQGRLLTPEWLVFDENFRGGVNVSAGRLNDQEMAIAVTPRGGMPPWIKLYSPDGKLLATPWLAFDEKFRGGVSVAIGDISGDGQAEIIAVASSGGGPQVRIFNRYGKLLGQFQAFSNEIKSGYQVMINDLDGSGRGQILVGQIN